VSIESKIESAFLKALKECDCPAALSARMALNEIPRPLWDKILDATAAAVRGPTLSSQDRP
jgi:hypothetical protein